MPDDQQQNPLVNPADASLPLNGVGDTSAPAPQAPLTVTPTSAADVPYDGQDLASPFDDQEPLPTGTPPVDVAGTDLGVPAAETPVAPSETGGEVPIPPEGVDLPNEGEAPMVISPQAPASTEQTTGTIGMTTPPVISPNEQPGTGQATEQQ
jgi:hypothetical protein